MFCWLNSIDAVNEIGAFYLKFCISISMNSTVHACSCSLLHGLSQGQEYATQSLLVVACYMVFHKIKGMQ